MMFFGETPRGSDRNMLMFFVKKNTPKVFAKLLGCRCYDTAFSFVNLCA